MQEDEMETKRCSKCGEEKPISEFHFKIKAKNIYQSKCKPCSYEWNREYNKRPEAIKRHRERTKTEHYKKKAAEWLLKPGVKERRREQARNRTKGEKHKAWRKEYESRPEVRERINNDMREYRKTQKWQDWNDDYSSKPEIIKRNAEYNARPEQKEARLKYQSTPEYAENRRIYMSEYSSRPDIRKKRLKYDREWKMNRYNCDPMFNINHRMASAVRLSLNGGKSGRSWESLVEYTVFDLKKHLEKQFKGGMTWERFLNGEIHIDHIVPRSVFNFQSTDDIDFKKCWALSNLQPLWASENISKGNKLEKPFQPSLAFG
jgi:hypothetical protein